MLAWTWGTWADIQIDFGREAYIAWRLSEGQALYRDLAYYNGPLSPYVNALWFKLFGVGIRTLVFCNLALLAALVRLLHALFCRIASRFAATAACLVFVLLFAFSQYVAVGNYNYVCPYSHDAVHGVLLSLLTIYCLGRFCDRPRRRWLCAAGACLGLTFLTRSEVFLAAAVGVAAGVLAMHRLQGDRRIRSARMIGTLLITAFAVPVLACLSLSTFMPLAQAVAGTLGTWPATLASPVASLYFFQLGSGLIEPGRNLLWMLALTGSYAVFFLPALVLAMRLRRPGRVRAIASSAAAILPAGCLIWLWWDEPSRRMLMPLPLLLLLICLFALRPVIRPRGSQADRTAAVLRVALSLFALVLLAKIVLYCRIHHYGFYLAMPATLLLVLALVGWIPQWIDRRGGCGRVFRFTALGAITGVTVTMLFMLDYWVDLKTVRISAHGDVLWADARRGQAFRVALEKIRERVGEDETMVAMPEGVMLNFLARRLNPTRHTNFMPTEMVLFGEENILSDLKAHPPDWVALVHKDTSEFGYRFFGSDYGRLIGAWLERDYRMVHGIGAMPLQSEEFGILLLRRAAPETSSPPAGDVGS